MKQAIISFSFYTPSGTCLMALDLIVVLNSVSGLKYPFVRYFIGQVYNKIKDKQILLNFINFTSLGSFISLNGEVVCNRHEITIFSKIKFISSN